MTWIKHIVDGLVELYHTRNVYELLDILEIILIKRELPEGEKGRSFKDMFNNEYIFVSNNLTSEEEKVIIAHELGHLILHTHLSTSYYSNNPLLSKDKIEKEANKFAAELLIPDDIVIDEDTTIQHLAYNLGVLEELVIIKYRKEF